MMYLNLILVHSVLLLPYAPALIFPKKLFRPILCWRSSIQLRHNLLLLRNKPWESSLVVSWRRWIHGMIGKLVNVSSWINSMICKCLVRTWHVLLKKMQWYFNRIGSTMLSEMDSEERDNVAMVPNEQLLYCMHSRRPTPLVSNILLNGIFLRLQLSKTSCCLINIEA